MRIVLRADALSDTAFDRHIDRIVGRIDQGVHEWEIEHPDCIESSAWYLKSREYVRLLFEKSAERSIWPRERPLHRRRLIVTANPQSVNELAPDRAQMAADEPLVILMENRFSDGLFITTVIRTLGPKELGELLEARPEAIRLDGGGGNRELPKLVATHVGKAIQSGIPIRAVVFTDSDALWPGGISRAAKSVEVACNTHNVPFCMLQKRSIENYIPDEVLLAWCNAPNNVNYRNCVEALKRLSADQRDHFHMKGGFDASPNTTHSALFDDATENDIALLSRGFGKQVIETIDEYHSAITPEGMRARDHQGDLDKLIGIILEEI